MGSQAVDHFPWISAYRWNAATGIETPGGNGLMRGRAISDDGTRVLTDHGFSTTHGLASTAALWTPTGVEVFPGIGEFPIRKPSMGSNLSRDGRFVAGWGWLDLHALTRMRGWIWDTQGHVQLLDSEWGGETQALDVSDDGRAAVGVALRQRSYYSFPRAALWVDGKIQLLTDEVGSAAHGTNHDGSFVTGAIGFEPFLWSAAEGLVELESIPPVYSQEYTASYGKQVSDDGSTVLAIQDYLPPGGYRFEVRRFLWRRGAGAVDVRNLLPALGAEGLEEFQSIYLNSLGADGRTLFGQAWRPEIPQETWFWRALLPPSAEVYCSAQTSSGGCTPAIGFEGTPSARTGAGFQITASAVTADARALLVYGTSGAANVPFGGGVLCVAAPFTRALVEPAAGNGPCDGTLAVDFNALIAQSGNPEFVGGAHVWAQFWMRDDNVPPPHLLLSDAVTFTLWP